MDARAQSQLFMSTGPAPAAFGSVAVVAQQSAQSHNLAARGTWSCTLYSGGGQGQESGGARPAPSRCSCSALICGHV
eukprot:scaffold1667_cov98-Isochrysis_galbana.AAC.1